MADNDVEMERLPPLTPEEYIAAANLQMEGSGFALVRRMTRDEMEREFPRSTGMGGEG
jgi:hypothetical protein